MSLLSTPIYTRISYKFTTLRPSLLVGFGRSVVKCLTDNDNYDPQDPTLAVLTAQLDSAQAATLNALNRDRVAIAVRNTEIVSLTVMLRQLATYVQNACAGDLAVLLTSGFLPVRTRTPVGQLGMPTGFNLSLNGNSGEVLAKWKRVPNAASYLVQFAITPDGEFTSLMPCTAARLVLTGLTPLKTIYVRVCANGSAGAGLFTPAIPVTVL